VKDEDAVAEVEEEDLEVKEEEDDEDEEEKVESDPDRIDLTGKWSNYFATPSTSETSKTVLKHGCPNPDNSG
jgi:hypothetical protein